MSPGVWGHVEACWWCLPTQDMLCRDIKEAVQSSSSFNRRSCPLVGCNPVRLNVSLTFTSLQTARFMASFEKCLILLRIRTVIISRSSFTITAMAAARMHPPAYPFDPLPGMVCSSHPHY